MSSKVLEPMAAKFGNRSKYCSHRVRPHQAWRSAAEEVVAVVEGGTYQPPLRSSRVPGPLQLHQVVLGVVDVDRQAFALGPEALPDLTHARAARLEMLHNGVHVKRLDPQADVIQVAAFLAGRCATFAPEQAVDWHQIDHRIACAQVNQAEIGATPSYCAAQDVAVEGDHPLQLAHPQDDVVDVADPEHAHAGAPVSRSHSPAPWRPSQGLFVAQQNSGIALGVYAQSSRPIGPTVAASTTARFYRAQAPTSAEFTGLARQVAQRIDRYLERQGCRMGKLNRVTIRGWIRAGERFDGRSHADGLVLSWHSDTGSRSRMLPYLCESTIGVAMSKVRRGLPQFTMRAFGSPLGDRC